MFRRIIFILVSIVPLCLCAQDTLQLVMQYEKSNETAKAITLSEQYIQSHPADEQANMILGNIFLSKALYERAIDCYSVVLAKNARHAEALKGRAFCLLSKGDYKQSRLDWIDFCRIDTGNADGWFFLASTEHRMGKYREAMEDYTHSLRIKKSAICLQERANLYLKMNKYKKAMQDIDTALMYNQHSPELFLIRGMALIGLKKYQESIDMFNRVQRLDKNNPHACYSRGRAYHQLKQYEKAEADFTEAIRLKPDFELAYFNRAISRMEQGRMHDPVSVCDDFMKAASYGYGDAIYYLKKYCDAGK